MYDVWGHFEATKASEATKMAFRGNMQMVTGEIKVTELKSETRCDLWGYLEATIARPTEWHMHSELI